MTDQQRSRAEASARRAESYFQILTDLGLRRTDAALFTVLHYGQTTTPEFLPCRAAAEDYNPIGPKVGEEECRGALADCLAKGWLQIIDEPTRERILEDLRAGQYIGPVYPGGGPDIGCVDFTEVGLVLSRRLDELTCPGKRPPCAYTDVVHEKTARFFRTEVAALAAIEECRSQDDVSAVTGPTPIGPWRAQWWRRFPEGYRVDIEERRQWQGRGSGGGENCYIDSSTRKADPSRLQCVLDRHNVTLAEWLMMKNMEKDWFRNSADKLCRGAAESGDRFLGVTISPEACREGLEACLRYGWLRVLDPRAIDEVRTLLLADSAILALPRTAEGREQTCYYSVDPLRPGRSQATPIPDTYWLGWIDFTPTGANLYRIISAEWLGPDWEDDLVVMRGNYWEEHNYCETDEGFDPIVQEHIAKGDVVRACRLVPIGPWCVYWWERFPAGYRLELELGDPD